MPTGPMRRACNTLVTPHTSRAVNTAQAMYASSPPAARITITGVMMMPAHVSATNCAARPKESTWLGLSNGS